MFMYVCMYVYITLCTCHLKLFVPHPRCAHETNTARVSKIKQQHRQRPTKVRVRVHVMPDCWLEVGLHPEGPATGQLDHGFPWFSSVPGKTLSWYPNSTSQCMLHMELSHS
jgi:hypothetical protein